ncbi:MAG: ATP-binding protein [Streptomyces sp.]|jgi:signal transduction histidine kinase|nr:ATP-binding protein [Streptomyces sp.]
MSHLRAPAARADRHEGGRHGRPVARTLPPLPRTRIKPRLLRLAILPPVAVALSACAALLYTVYSTGLRPAPTLWAVLAGALGVTLVGIAIAALAAGRAARSVAERLDALRGASTRGEAELRTLVEALRRGETPPAGKSRGKPAADADDFELLAAELARVHDAAVATVVQAAQLSTRTGDEQKLEVFANLARRLQPLVHQEISTLDKLEQEIEDPELLKGLFHVDHLATRIRRHAENLAVLGGAVPRRQWNDPVPMTEVLRSAIAEVEQYARIDLVPPIEGTLRGHAVSDVIHLLAELVENATVFSAPHTQVLLRASLVTSGLAVEVEDRGPGMPSDEQNRMNATLAAPDQVNVAGLLADGHIGLFTVAQLARRHGIQVRLQTNIYGGVQAVLVLPQGLLGVAALGTSAAMTSVAPQGRTAEGTGPLGVPVTTGGQGAEVTDAHAMTRPPQGTSPVHLSPSASEHPDPKPPDSVPADPWQSRREHTPAVRDRPPLPVRDTDGPRTNPAETPSAVRADDQPTTVRRAIRPPAPQSDTVHDAFGKPRLPRRHAHERIAPQLLDDPAPLLCQEIDRYADRHIDQDTAPCIGHDPGLMAAFQRGFGLAEARQQPEPGLTAPDTHTKPATAPDNGVPDDAPAPLLGLPSGDPTHRAEARARHTYDHDHDHDRDHDHDLIARHDGGAPTG